VCSNDKITVARLASIAVVKVVEGALRFRVQSGSRERSKHGELEDVFISLPGFSDRTVAS
jgi:hypothetical protein